MGNYDTVCPLRSYRMVLAMKFANKIFKKIKRVEIHNRKELTRNYLLKPKTNVLATQTFYSIGFFGNVSLCFSSSNTIIELETEADTYRETYEQCTEFE